MDTRMNSSGEENLPPKISDDEEEEQNHIHQLYSKELGQGFFPKRQNGERSIQREERDDKPYSEWKSKNHHLFNHFSESVGENSEMVSSLGQNLEKFKSFIPQGKGFSPSSSGGGAKGTQKKFSPQILHESQGNDSNWYNGAVDSSVPQRAPTANKVPIEYLNSNPQEYRHYQQPHYNEQPPLPYHNDSQYQLSPIHRPYNHPRQPYIPHVNHGYSPKELHHWEMTRGNVPQNFDSPKGIPPYLHPPIPQHYNQEHPSNKYEQPFTSPKHHLNHSCPCDSKSLQLHKKENKKAEKLKAKQISDLYRIVWLQNEQLALLQNQVKKLIEISLKNESDQKPIEQETSTVNKKYLKGTKEMRTFNLSVIEENQNKTEKVSVGIMTSFIENGIARKKKSKEMKKSNKNYPKSSTSDSSSSESSSSESSPEEEHFVVKRNKPKSKKNKLKREDSFTLNGVEIPTVMDTVPSPPTSFHLEMQDYKSSSGSETDMSGSSSESVDEDSKPVGWTFYDNVVGKVNNMLKKSVEHEDEPCSDDDIRNATLDQLRKLGVSFIEPENLGPKRVTFNNDGYHKVDSSPQQRLQADSDTSMRMNALASKYLRGEQIPPAIEESKGREVVLPNQAKSNPNLSFATMKYLERYKLVPRNSKESREDNVKEERKEKTKSKKKKSLEGKKIKKSSHHRNVNSGKILDITAIKQQPKLLPKKI